MARKKLTVKVDYNKKSWEQKTRDGKVKRFTRSKKLLRSGLTKKVPDKGAKGRGKKLIPKLKKGALGISFKQPEKVIKSILKKKALKEGEKKIAGRLMAISILNKRTNTSISKRAAELASWVSGSFKGKKYVGYPKGFS